jgi:hypothetical protein
LTERDMSFFMKGRAAQLPEEEVVVTKRFVDDEGKPIPFRLRALPVERVEQLQDECMRPVKSKGRRAEKELDSKRFATRLGIESTLYPEFRDTALLQSYGVNDPVDLVKLILSLPGEYAEWINAVQRVNGLDEDFDELVEDAKN